MPVSGALAQQTASGSLMQVASRDVAVPVYAVWRPDAVATLVLFSGGAGGFGRLGADGWPGSANFLIRSAKLWAAYPVNLVMVGRPADISDLDGPARIGNKHAQDNAAVLREVKRHSAAPVWLVGTSMGAISATATAIADAEHLVAGLVLASSVTAYRIPGAVPAQDLAKIRVPVLVMSHENDACPLSQPKDGQRIRDGLANAPVKQLLLVSGGSGASGNVCEALHWHGFVGMEQQAVDAIVGWILHPVNRP